MLSRVVGAPFLDAIKDMLDEALGSIWQMATSPQKGVETRWSSR